MAKSNGQSENGPARDVVKHYWTPVEGAATVADTFPNAGGAVFIGHRTFANVPFDRSFKEGDPMTAAQAAFLSAAVIRSSLGNDDLGSVDKTAAIEIRAIPAQYSALEDAADSVVCQWLNSRNDALGRRQDREVMVARVLAAKPTQKFTGLNVTLGQAIQNEGRKLTNERKAVKGTGAAKPGQGATVDEMFAE